MRDSSLIITNLFLKSIIASACADYIDQIEQPTATWI
jgi:hypothetical protein